MATDIKNTGYDGATLSNSTFKFDRRDTSLIMAHLYVGFIAILLGGLAGLLQVLQKAGYIQLPSWIGYYQLLTVHGVLLALVFTTFFIIGYLYSGVAKTIGGVLSKGARTVGWWGFWLMTIGTAMAAIPILMNDATVLYTFYAPMKASFYYYLGLTLVIVGSWFGGIAIFMEYSRWKKQHRGETSPLFAYMAVATMILWIIATLGVAVESLVQLLPWSLGLVEKIDVALSRTLFWYFGHPLVYFWLLPAYIYWYVNIPKIIKGKLFSDALPRLTFILFILYSVPVGLHHQLQEPGIGSAWKFVQVALTYVVAIPSLMTAFAMLATFEMAGRAQGATGRFGWFKKLPWGDVRFFAPFLAMVMFIPAGAGGIVNTSYQLNQVVHNTTWITGHFHMTLATAVVLTFFGISYWLIAVLKGRKLTQFANKLGIWQAITWFVGMLFMSVPQHILGIMGMPRRTSFTTYGDHEVALTWLTQSKIMGIGGALLFLGILLYLWNVAYMLWAAPKTDTPMEYPIGEVTEGAAKTPRILENWWLWIGITFALVLIAYTVPFMDLLRHGGPAVPGLRVW